MSSTVDIAFVFLPANDFDRLAAGEAPCEISAFGESTACCLVTKERMLSGERHAVQLVFAQDAPPWLRKGLALRLRRTPGDEPLGAAIVQDIVARS